MSNLISCNFAGSYCGLAQGSINHWAGKLIQGSNEEDEVVVAATAAERNKTNE
jgi:hypothetical protein